MYRHLAMALAAAAFCGTAGLAGAQALVYVDAKDGYYPDNNLYEVSGGALTTLIEPGNNTTVNGDGRFPNDGAWHWANFGSPWGTASQVGSVCGLECTSVYESLEEDAPMMGMRLGLEPGAAYQLDPMTEYDVYAVYWGDDAGNWAVQAGLSSTNLSLFDTEGADIEVDTEGTVVTATQGALASSAAWAVRPLDNRTDGNDPEDAFYPPSDDNENPFLDATPGSEENFWRTMRLGLIGQATPTASGQIDVFIEDLPSVEGGSRSFFDGLAFVPSGTTVFTQAEIDRATGELTITNPTAVDFQIESISITSETGSLDATMWENVANDNVISDPDGDWAVTSRIDPSVLELAEGDAGDGDGVTWLSGGTTASFGEVWRQGVYEDVVVNLNLVGGGTVEISPEYAGTAYASGDFDADGDIDVDDYIRLVQGLHADHATDSLAYSLGDINESGAVDRNDVLAFAETYDVFNGVGAFDEMVLTLANVPEPSTSIMASLMAGLFLGSSRRRRSARPNRTSPAAGGRRWAAPLCLLAAVAVLAASGKAEAADVINWQNDSLLGSTTTLSNANTNSPIVGDLGPGGYEADGALNGSIWGETPIPVNLINGQEVALTGFVTFYDSDDSGMSFNVGGFRYGLFNDVTEDANAAPEAGWLGYLANSSGNNGDGLGDGRFTVRNPDNAAFVGTQPTDSPISTNVTASGLGADDGEVFILAEGGTPEGAVPGRYEFSIVVGAYGDEVTLSTFMRLVDAPPVTGDYNEDGRVDAADFTVWRDNLGTGFALPNRDPANTGNISSADYDSWVAAYGDEEATYNFRLGGGVDTDALPHPTIPTAINPDTEMEYTAEEVTDHVSTSFNRVMLFTANHSGIDGAEYEDVQIVTRAIESVTLEVNVSTGAVSLKNVSSTDFDMTYYEITSPSGSLVEGAWDSLAPNDVVDGIEWDRAGGSDEFILSEVNLLGTPLDIPTGVTPISLGSIFDTAGEQDLTLFFTNSNGDLIRGIVDYVGGGALIATPEPSALGMLALAGLGAACRRRRQ